MCRRSRKQPPSEPRSWHWWGPVLMPRSRKRAKTSSRSVNASNPILRRSPPIQKPMNVTGKRTLHYYLCLKMPPSAQPQEMDNMCSEDRIIQRNHNDLFVVATSLAPSAIANAAQSSGSPRSEAEWEGRCSRFLPENQRLKSLLPLNYQ